MIAEWNMQEAARLVERARCLLQPHHAEQPGLVYFERTWASDAAALRNLARTRREQYQREGWRLFA